VIASRQTIWARSELRIQSGARSHGRLNVHAAFGIAMPVSSLAPASTGITLAFQDDADDTMLEIDLPAGPRWTARRGGWRYRDPRGSVDGVRRVEITDATRGGVPGVVVALSARDGAYPVGASALPVALTVVLGDTKSGQAGACGRHDFDAASCASGRGGGRLVCR
jgi:hypothetical protein